MAYLPKTVADVKALVQERDIRFIRFWFTDVLGQLKSFSINSQELDDAFEAGMGFDGSSITGFNAIEESDMIAMPDPSTFAVLPWRPEEQGVGRMFCDTVEVTRGDTRQQLRFTTGFLWMCQGYYNHAKPYRPQWDGMDRFEGDRGDPQRWPGDLDLADKNIVVIGSGATAATLIPAIAEQAEHVTMLQRSPSYYFAPPTTNELAVTLRALDIPEEWTHEILRRHYIQQFDWLTRTALEAPRTCTRSSSSPCARCCPRASTWISTSSPATARGSSASLSSPTAICSQRCAEGRPRS